MIFKPKKKDRVITLSTFYSKWMFYFEFRDSLNILGML